MVHGLKHDRYCGLHTTLVLLTNGITVNEQRAAIIRQHCAESFAALTNEPSDELAARLVKEISAAQPKLSFGSFAWDLSFGISDNSQCWRGHHSSAKAKER